MSQPFLDLQKILTTQATHPGRVVSLASGKVRVATRNGIIEVPDSGGFAVGDMVNITGGIATKVQQQGRGDVPVFYV
ncbi:MAG: hypothetical protein HQL73_02705 [Magnetococcales bacterium]|nr:hypothetical protein [Magnetococcales bacterium]